MDWNDKDIWRFLERTDSAPVDVVDVHPPGLPLNREEWFLLFGLTAFVFGPLVTTLATAATIIWRYTQKLPLVTKGL